MRPSPVTFLFPSLAYTAACFLCIATASGQTQEVFELQNGRRIPAESVKPGPGGFTATITVGTALQTVNFSAKEVVRATLREPREISEGRLLIASDKAAQAVDVLAKAETALLPYQSIPDSWWVRAALLHMDALSVLGKNKEAAAIASQEVLSNLSPDNAALLKDFQQVTAAPGKEASGKLESLHTIAERTVDPWLGARVWLEIGNTLAMQGKIEDAVKAWLRVPVFFPAEKDLAVRGTILAARGLQQLQRPEDGIKLLDDYLADHIGTPYKETIQTETAKLKPKSIKPATTTEAPKEPAETTK